MQNEDLDMLYSNIVGIDDEETDGELAGVDDAASEYESNEDYEQPLNPIPLMRMHQPQPKVMMKQVTMIMKQVTTPHKVMREELEPLNWSKEWKSQE